MKNLVVRTANEILANSNIGATGRKSWWFRGFDEN